MSGNGHEFCGAFIYPAGGCHREPGHPKRHSKAGDTMTVWRAPSGRLHLRKGCSGGTTGARIAKITYQEYALGTRCPCLERAGWKADWQRSPGALRQARRMSGT